MHAGATVTHKDGSTGRVTGYVRATQTATVDWHGGKRAGKTGTTKAYHLQRPDGGQGSFHYEFFPKGKVYANHEIHAHNPLTHEQVGRIAWQPGGNIVTINVNSGYRRQGIATELWNRAKSVDPEIKHTPSSQSDAGRLWAGSLKPAFGQVNPTGKTSAAGRVVSAKPSGPVHNPNRDDPFAAFETNSKPPPAPKIEQVLGDPVTNRRPKLAEEKLVTDHLNGLIARHGVGEYGAPPSVSVRDLSKVKGNNAESAKTGIAAQYHRHLHLIEIDHRHLAGPNSVPSGQLGKAGYFSASGGASFAQRTLTHEFGHSLDRHLTPDRRAQMMREVAAAIPGANSTGTKTMGPAAWVQANKEHVINHVSTYASANDRELIAELFAEFEHSRSPSPAARVVGRYLSKSGGAR